MIPARIRPVVMAMMTASGWMATARPMMTGCRTCPSNCCTTITAPSTSSALIQPTETSATRTATVPDTVAPTIGMNAPRKTSAASGNASGTPSATSASPMPTASMNATRTVARTYDTRVVQDASPAAPTGATAPLGSSDTMKPQIRRPSRSRKNVANSTRRAEANTSSAVAAVVTAPLVSASRWVSSQTWIWSAMPLSWALVSLNGPSRRLVWIWRMPLVAFSDSAGNELTNWVTTSVNTPPTAAMPQIRTTATASEGGSRPYRLSQATQGASSADSSSAMLNGMRTPLSWPINHSRMAAPVASTSSRQHQPAAIRRPCGMSSSSRLVTEGGADGTGRATTSTVGSTVGGSGW